MDLFEAVEARYIILYRRNLIRRQRNLSLLVEQCVFPCRTIQRLTIGSCGLGFANGNIVNGNINVNNTRRTIQSIFNRLDRKTNNNNNNNNK
mmetsp:Transcript_13393/g.14384  ORF Transcript_13393/g.14384 Transcript_13393/m.14384 type:complete len:92 (+) Transcript_13393:192-467(+)